MPTINSLRNRFTCRLLASRQLSRLGKYLILVIPALLTTFQSAAAWRVIETYRIPDGTLAMCAINSQLWCGTSSNDSTISIIDSENGMQVGSRHAPESICRGIAYAGGSVWFLGETRLYRMNVNGGVQSVQNVPFEGMVGLTADQNGLWTIDHSQGNSALVLFNFQGGEVRRLGVRTTDALDLHFDGASFWITSPPDGFIHQLRHDAVPQNIFPTPANNPTGLTMINSLIYLVDNGDEQEGDILYQIDPAREAAPRVLPGSRLYHYGLVNIFGSEFWDMSIYNVGNVDLNIQSIGLINGDRGFTRGQIPQRLIVAPGQYMIVRMTFSPREYGSTSDTLIIRSNDPIDSVLAVIVEGFGIYAERTLGITPIELNFGDVRADPARDGSRHLSMYLFNKGSDSLTVRSIENGIPEIFSIDLPRLPIDLGPTDTLTVNVWFTPHRAINFVDTILVHSTAVVSYETALMRGHGDATVYDGGEVLWQSRPLQESGSNAAVGFDINGDGIREVYGFQDDGIVRCFNGFSSVAADILWTQSFEDVNNAPQALIEEAPMHGGLHLSNYRSGDLLFASSGVRSAVFALSGEDGSILWTHQAGDILAGGEIAVILPGEDIDGNGETNPLVLVNSQENSCVARLEGYTGATSWYVSVERSTGLTELRDFTGDGVKELLAYNTAGSVAILNGLSGRLVRSFQIPEFFDLDFGHFTIDGEYDFLFIAAADSTIKGIDIETGDVAWSLREVMGMNVGIADCIRFPDQYVSPALAFGNRNGDIGVITDLLNGRGARLSHYFEGPITFLVWDDSFYLEGPICLLAGDINSRIGMIHPGTMAHLWNSAEIENGGEVTSILPFDDVDFGGTNDVVATFANGDILCISSGGDFDEVRETRYSLPADYIVANAYPNPFNDRLSVEIRLIQPASVKIIAFDGIGRRLGTQDLGMIDVGVQRFDIDDGILRGAAGAIYLNIEISGKSSVIKSVYLK